MDFNKRPLTIEEQIALLKERGMVIPDKAKAKMLLSNVSYYRLSAYWYTLIENPKTDHLFIKGTSFETALNTYVFDRKLRLLIFE